MSPTQPAGALSSPANDNGPRTLADQLGALLDYVRARAEAPPDPLASTWSVVPSDIVEWDAENDGTQSAALAWREEFRHEVYPSKKTIQNNWLTDGQFDISKVERDEAGQIVKIGKLIFSDGSQHERAYRRNEAGQIEPYLRRMPAGAMLGETISLKPRGGKKDPSSSNARLQHRLFFNPDGKALDGNNSIIAVEPDQPKGELRTFKPKKGKARSGESLTPRQSRELIAAAMANTTELPPVTKCPPGIASGCADYGKQFLGMKVGRSGKAKGGAVNWTDMVVAQREHEEWAELAEKLDAISKVVLSSLATARNLTDVGEAIGQSSEYARRKGGRRALIAANDNIAALLKGENAA